MSGLAFTLEIVTTIFILRIKAVSWQIHQNAGQNASLHFIYPSLVNFAFYLFRVNTVGTDQLLGLMQLAYSPTRTCRPCVKI